MTAPAAAKTVYLLRSQSSQKYETYCDLTELAMEERLRQHNLGSIEGFSRAYHPYDAALWVENVPAADDFLTAAKGKKEVTTTYGTTTKSYTLFKEWVEATYPDQVKAKAFTKTQFAALAFIHQLLDPVWKSAAPLILNIACDLEPKLIPKLPDHVTVRHHKCPWPTLPAKAHPPAAQKRPKNNLPKTPLRKKPCPTPTYIS